MTDAASRLSEDDQLTYVYDANGNLTSKTDKVTPDTTGYTWDAQDQLIRIDFPDLTFAQYRYDGLGRRIEKDVNGTLTRYVYDGSDILLEFNGAGTLLARTSHGQGTDQPLAVERGGQEFFYHADHQGSVRKITDAAGLVVNSYDYDSYGNIEASFEGVANPFTYTGRERDVESGLYYYRARYYDPSTGKFLSDDPSGFAAGDFNLSRYVFNNPVNLTDPSGEFVVRLLAGCVIGGTIDAGAQLIGNGGQLGCLDFGGIAGGCVAGGVGAALGPTAGRLAAQAFGRVAQTVRAARATRAAQKAARSGGNTKSVDPRVRGRASEQRVLKDEGLSKNTEKVTTNEGNAVPDALTRTKSIEIKDTACVSCTKQIRIQTKAAKASGKESVLITGTRTRIRGPAEKAFDRIIRRGDLGPQ